MMAKYPESYLCRLGEGTLAKIDRLTGNRAEWFRDLVDGALGVESPLVLLDERMGALEVEVAALRAVAVGDAGADFSGDLLRIGRDGVGIPAVSEAVLADGGEISSQPVFSMSALNASDVLTGGASKHESVIDALVDFLGDGEASVPECAQGLGVSVAAIEGEIGSRVVMDGGLLKVA